VEDKVQNWYSQTSPANGFAENNPELNA